jgi:hypothetical protein
MSGLVGRDGVGGGAGAHAAKNTAGANTMNSRPINRIRSVRPELAGMVSGERSARKLRSDLADPAPALLNAQRAPGCLFRTRRGECWRDCETFDRSQLGHLLDYPHSEAVLPDRRGAQCRFGNHHRSSVQ